MSVKYFGSDALSKLISLIKGALNGKANTSDLGTAASKDVAVSGNASTTQVVMGNDTRLTDARTPTSHTHNYAGSSSAGGDATRALKVKDAGANTDITFQCSGPGVSTASWYAVWNGYKIEAMSKADMKSQLGVPQVVPIESGSTFSKSYSKYGVFQRGDKFYVCSESVSAGTNWTDFDEEYDWSSFNTLAEALVYSNDEISHDISHKLGIYEAVYCGQKSGTTRGYRATAEGRDNIASQKYAHAEGYLNTASEEAAHAEGIGNTASGKAAHAEGNANAASGSYSHAGGYTSNATQYAAFAHGSSCQAMNQYSAAFGLGTYASLMGQFACGKYNNYSNNYNAYSLIVGKGSSSARANSFRTSDSGVYGAGAYHSSGADYAEMFEWADANTNSEDRVGRFVKLNGSKIELSESIEDEILGIVSAFPSVCGDVFDDQWQGMFLFDIFGRPLYEYINVPEEKDTITLEDGTTKEIIVSPAHTERRQKLNPAYDNTREYLPRSNRPEWDAVGMLGKLVMIDDGTAVVNGYVKPAAGGIATKSMEKTKFRVMERLDEEHIKVLILTI